MRGSGRRIPGVFSPVLTLDLNKYIGHGRGLCEERSGSEWKGEEGETWWEEKYRRM